LAAERPDEPLLHEQVAFAHEDGFIDYLARRLCVETGEARVRLSAWLSAYEPPARSGMHGPPRDPNEASERARSA
jgi:hypothetical protein